LTLNTGHFQTTDPCEFAQELSPLTPNPPVVEASGADFHAKVRWVALPRLGCFSVESGTAHIIDDGDGAGLGINVPLNGRYTFRLGQERLEIEKSGCFIRRAGDPFDMMASEKSSLLVVHLSGALLESLSKKLGRELLFDVLDVSGTPEFQSFSRYLRWSWREFRCGAPFLGSPLAVEEFENSLAASFLLVAEQTHREEEVSAFASAPRWLALAEDYLEAHIADPVSLAELAEVAGVSMRTLSRGFRERHGVGAITFLKHRRLDAIQRALQAADAKCLSVTELAMRYGFAHLSRFASDYRKRFGELPSTTLVN
jgi:AraC-like DNA-binding protein